MPCSYMFHALSPMSICQRLHDCPRKSHTPTRTSYYFGMSTFRPVMTVKWKPSTTAQPQAPASPPNTVPKPPFRFTRPRNGSQPGSWPAGQHHFEGLWTTAAAERALACSLLGFGAVAFDVFSPASLHLLAGVDTAAHGWVTAHIPPALQRIVMGKLISDTGIVLGLLGWAGVTVYAATSTQSFYTSTPAGAGEDKGTATTSRSSSASSSSTLQLGHALLVAAVGYAAGGAFKHDDPLVVSLLKHLFGRSRPGLGHSTFAFPSGHTTAAVYIVGTLLCLLLPVLLDDEQRRNASQQQGQQPRLHTNRASAAAAENRDLQGAASAAASASQAADDAGRGPLLALLESLLQHRPPLWAGAAVVTAAGRVLADAHWVSDTMAGACLGIALVSATVLGWRLLGVGEEQRAQ